MWSRAIVFVDMNAFFASIEQRYFPDLRGKPVAVTNGATSTCVITSSYEARACGVKNSKKIEGHSCYTWARYELKKIGLDVPKNPLDKLIAIPDFVIKPENPSLEAGTGGCRIL